ncbi:MAG: glycosyltransferase family 2 protein [Flavobacteriaceae bacterium]
MLKNEALKIAVVILNWNGKPLLEQFLPSVLAYSGNADIYVADNASTDGSVAFVQAYFPSINIIQNTENGGYTKGYNEALKYINADIFCLLNSDVEVTPNWLLPVIETFNNKPNTAIIQPKILDFKTKDYFEYAGAAGGFIDKYAFPYCRGRIFSTIEKDCGQYNDIADVFWASGACLFVRSAIFKQLNGFDARFFAHFEEIDLCWRAKNAGYTVTYVGTSAVYHVGGATLNNANPKKTFLNFRNSLISLTKNVPKNVFPTLLIRLFLDGIAGVMFIFQLKPRHTLAIIKAHFSFYAHLKSILKQRKHSNKTINYFKVKSIVTEYFIFGKKTYRS